MPTTQHHIESRVSVNFFDTQHSISNEQIQELIRLATLAPSAYNLQNWKFIAVSSKAGKEKLKSAAYGQQKVVDAAVTFIICGTLNAHRSLENTLSASVNQGIFDQSVADAWVAMAKGSHEGHELLQRDEAFRSASLAAMTLMLAAEEMGLATGPMSGFDPGAVAAAFELPADVIPVMLIATGHAAPGNWPQKPRKPIPEVLSFA